MGGVAIIRLFSSQKEESHAKPQRTQSQNLTQKCGEEFNARAQRRKENKNVPLRPCVLALIFFLVCDLCVFA
jgi:hypothetical protein